MPAWLGISWAFGVSFGALKHRGRPLSPNVQWNTAWIHIPLMVFETAPLLQVLEENVLKAWLRSHSVLLEKAKAVLWPWLSTRLQGHSYRVHFLKNVPLAHSLIWFMSARLLGGKHGNSWPDNLFFLFKIYESIKIKSVSEENKTVYKGPWSTTAQWVSGAWGWAFRFI